MEAIRELLVTLDPGDRPDHHLIEVGARGPLFSGGVSHIHLQGVHFTRAANVGTATVELSSASDWLIEDNLVSWNNWAGIGIHGWGHVLRRNIAEQNGDEGIGGGQCQNVLLDANISRLNNWQRGINFNWHAGGGKFVESDHIVIRNHEAAFNNGPGVWFDINNTNVIVENSRAHHNAYAGLFMEIASGPFVFRGNTCFANSEAGIVIGESAHGIIENNTLAANKIGLELRNIPGRLGNGTTSSKDGHGDWKVDSLTIRRNIIARNAVAGIANTAAPIDVARDQITSDFNLYWENPAVLWQLQLPTGATATGRILCGAEVEQF